MGTAEKLVDIEQKVLNIGEVVGHSLASESTVDLTWLSVELYKIRKMIGEIKDEGSKDTFWKSVGGS